MSQILEAVYQNGNLILKEKLSSNLEGKSVKLIILENDQTEQKKEQFLKLIDQHHFPLPQNYQFNRDEIYIS